MMVASSGAASMAIRPERQLVYEWYTPSLARSVAFLQAVGFTALRREEAFAEMAWEEHSRLLVEQVPLDDAPDMPAGYQGGYTGGYQGQGGCQGGCQGGYQGGYHGNLRVLVPDVDAVYRVALVVADGKILKPLEDRYYGLRDFTLGGPFGLALRFATPLPGFSED